MRKDIIGSKLLEERKNQGKTLRDIAHKLGWSLSTLSSIERGFISVADEKYIEYAKELGIAEDLFGIEDEMTKREKEIMKELKHIEDISIGNQTIALERINNLTDIHHFSDAIAFSEYLKGRIYYFQQDYKRSKKHFESALKKLDECPNLANSNLPCICYSELARIAFYDNQDYEASYQLTNQAIDVFAPDGHRNYFKAHLLLNQAIYLEELDRLEESCSYVEQLLKEKEILKPNDITMIQAYERYAVVLTKLGMPFKALDYAKEGLQLAWENKSHLRLFSMWITIGDIFSAIGNYEVAIINYQKSLDFIHHAKDKPHHICELYFRFGQALARKGEIKESENKLLFAQKYSNKTKSSKFKLEIHHLLGKIQRTQHKFTEARETYKKIEEMFKFSSDYIPVDICLELCEFYKDIRNEDKSNYYQRLLYQNLKEELG
jgi:tetratricopeptide (TPR) repeat protein